MPQPGFIVAGVIGGIAVIGGGIFLFNSMTGGLPNGSGDKQETKQQIALNDPDGTYALFSDPSVTKHPEDGVRFGNGQTLTFVYDGSKTAQDPYTTLSYQLFYIQDDGKVQPMVGGNVEGKGSGTFTLSDKVYNSLAANRSGFLELVATHDASVVDGKISATTVKLGMYSIAFEVAE